MSEKEFIEYQEFLKHNGATLIEHYKKMRQQRDNLLEKYNDEVKRRKAVESFIQKYEQQGR